MDNKPLFLSVPLPDTLPSAYLHCKSYGAFLKFQEHSYSLTILQHLHSVSLYKECSYPRYLHAPFIFSFSLYLYVTS